MKTLKAKDVMAPIGEKLGLLLLQPTSSEVGLFDGKTHTDLELLNGKGKATIYFQLEDLPKVEKFIRSMLKKSKQKPLSDYKDILIAFDPDYFSYEGERKGPVTLEKAAYALATFIFDHDARKDTLEDMQKRLPANLYAMALTYYRNNRHDT